MPPHPQPEYFGLSPSVPHLWRVLPDHWPEKWNEATGLWEHASQSVTDTWFRSPHELHDLTEPEARARFPAAFSAE